MEYDLTRLEQLGKRAEKLREELEALRPELVSQILAALYAGVPQVRVAKAARYTRDGVYKIARPRTDLAERTHHG